jgi:hypothetical protein
MVPPFQPVIFRILFIRIILSVRSSFLSHMIKSSWKYFQTHDNITFWPAETSGRLVSPARKLSLVPRLALQPASKARFPCPLVFGCPPLQHARLFLCYHGCGNAFVCHGFLFSFMIKTNFLFGRIYRTAFNMEDKMKRVSRISALIPLLIVVLIFFPSCKKKEGISQPPITYPETRKGEVVDDYFGTQVPDPYRWMEDDNAPEVKEWVAKQNDVTFGYLENIPFRDKIRQRLTELYDYPKYSSPSRAGEYYFFYKNEGLQNQRDIYIQKGLEGEPEVFIDPNQLSPDGTIRIYLVGFSEDYKYVT